MRKRKRSSQREHVDALELKVRVAVVRTRGVNTVLITDHLPELRADLVAALAALDVHELTHECKSSEITGSGGGLEPSEIRFAQNYVKR